MKERITLSCQLLMATAVFSKGELLGKNRNEAIKKTPENSETVIIFLYLLSMKCSTLLVPKKGSKS